MWFDEAYTAEATGRSPAWWLANDQYHFLYDGLLALWAAGAGTSEWALRAPSVLGAMIAAALMVVLGRKFFDRWVALGERSVAGGKPLRGQVVAAGAELHTAARAESGRDARSHPSARSGDALVVGALRTRVRGRRRRARGRRHLARSRASRAHRPATRARSSSRSSRRGHRPRDRRALGSDRRDALDGSGRRHGVASAAVSRGGRAGAGRRVGRGRARGRVGGARSRSPVAERSARSRRLARRVGRRSVCPRARHDCRDAGVPRPLSHRRRACLCAPRGCSDRGGWTPIRVAARRCCRPRLGDRPRSVVFHGRRELARRGLEERRRGTSCGVRSH